LAQSLLYISIGLALKFTNELEIWKRYILFKYELTFETQSVDGCAANGPAIMIVHFDDGVFSING
jgi:hypothetical protein